MDAIKELCDYLAKSPSVVYPEDVLAYLPAVEAENAELREQGARLFDKVLELGTENSKLKDTGRALLQCVRKLNTVVTCEGAGCPVYDDCYLYRLVSDPRIEEIDD